jgi:acyl dehydratase
MDADGARRSLSLTKGPVTTTQLVMYAGASGDFNRIHFDLPFAQASGMPNVIAHGMLTMAFASQLLTRWGGPRSVVDAVSARFLAPVLPGDTVVLTGDVVSTREETSGTRVTLRFRGAVGDRKVIEGQGTVTCLGERLSTAA